MTRKPPEIDDDDDLRDSAREQQIESIPIGLANASLAMFLSNMHDLVVGPML